MRILILSSILLSSVITTTPVFAAQVFESGVYAGLSGGRASVSSAYADNSNDIALGATAGYQFTQNLGAEIFTRSLSLNPFRGVFAAAGYYPDQHTGVAVQGSVPLSEKFSAYGRVGIGRTKMESNRTSLSSYDETDPSVGVGASYAFNRNWSTNLEYLRLTKTDVNLISVGVRYQF